MDFRAGHPFSSSPVQLGHRSDGLQALCGMVNANRAAGTVVFGVDPTGHIGDKFEPPLYDHPFLSSLTVSRYPSMEAPWL